MVDKNINLRVRTTGAEKAEKKFKKLGSTIQSSIAAYGSAGIALYALVGVVKGSVDAFARQENAINKVNAILKSTKHAAGLTSEELQNMAKGLQDVTTFGDEAVLEAQALMLTFTKIGKDVFPTALEAAMDMSAVFGQDLQQSMIQLGTALNDPIIGVGRLRKIGISFTESQKATIKSLMEENDIMGAQKVILNELATEFGGYARAKTETFAGKLEILKNRLSDVQENLGSVLAKADEFTGFLGFLAKETKKVSDNMWNLVGAYRIWQALFGENEFKIVEPMMAAHTSVKEVEKSVEATKETMKETAQVALEFAKVMATLNIVGMEDKDKPIDRMGIERVIEKLEELKKIAPAVFAELDKDMGGIVANWDNIASSLSGAFDFAFSEALVREKNFAKAMEEGFKAMLQNMVAEFLSKAAVFGVLSLLTGGAFAPAGGALNFISGGMFSHDGGGFSPSRSSGGGGSSVNVHMPNVTMINSRSIGQIKQALSLHDRRH